jgi:hypothetical protein
VRVSTSHGRGWHAVGVRPLLGKVMLGAAVVALLGTSLAAAAPVASSSPGSFVPLTPCRAVNTKASAAGPVHGSRDFTLVGSPMTGQGGPAAGCGVPSEATAVVVNVTVANPTAAGWVAVFPAGQAWPGSSTVNFAAGVTIANGTTIPLGRSDTTGVGSVSVRDAGTGSENVIIDVTGYYVPASSGLDGTVPSGHTLTGVFSVVLPYQAEGFSVGTVTFAQPFAGELTAVWVPAGTNPTGCPGTPENPTAAPGYFCAYITQLIGATNNIVYPSSSNSPISFKAGPHGAMLIGNVSPGGSQSAIFGDWAATAP